MSNSTHTDRPKILLADDDQTFREPCAMILRRNGYDCVCAPDAATALKRLQESPVDALIADIHMPGNVELELIERIPELANGLPVILMTGLPSVETAARSVRLEVAAYLVKPPNMDDLLALLRDAIPRYHRLRAVSESRQHLREWSEELATLETRLRQNARSAQQPVTPDYLRLTLRHLILQLADLDHSIAAWKQLETNPDDLRQIDLVSAVRHTIEVLEKTRQSFHSKELGELRRQLRSLLPPDRD